jgi:hypothetical protein
MMGTGIRKSGKGQVFSVDVLLALLPLMMIIGSSLQYMYLAQEQSKSLVVNSGLEGAARAMSDYVVSSYYASGEPYINGTHCKLLGDAADEAYDRFLSAGNYAYAIRVYDYNEKEYLCNAPDETAVSPVWRCPSAKPACDSNVIYEISNTAASAFRLMPVYNDAETLLPGHIAGVSFAVWEDI